MIDVVIIAGSQSDKSFVDETVINIRGQFPQNDKINLKTYYASAHREPEKVLQILKDNPKGIFVTIAGKSNALSGMVAANCKNVVIALPVFADLTAYMLDIHSSLRMPRDVPVLTILDSRNCALAIKRILDLT